MAEGSQEVMLSSSPPAGLPPPTTPLTSQTAHLPHSDIILASPLSSGSPSSPPPTTTPDSDARPEAFSVSTILPSFLYLGPDPSLPEHAEELAALGIKRVLNMAVECQDELNLVERLGLGESGYRKVGIRDSVEEMGVAKGLKEAVDFLGAPSPVRPLERCLLTTWFSS